MKASCFLCKKDGLKEEDCKHVAISGSCIVCRRTLDTAKNKKRGAWKDGNSGREAYGRTMQKEEDEMTTASTKRGPTPTPRKLEERNSDNPKS
ncbi:hypothetical protein TSAR_007990 [Trichomalopsis sarcophagae]|uniref:Uncharacterized protein n=1 Tax=Trichomalopsis sarcophagae TaxID=543379 RepID=A0A232FN76_9HYME|nr:hypothetical protein TSAR_007990 [Trichomalopsis sarcophagae]